MKKTILLYVALFLSTTLSCLGQTYNYIGSFDGKPINVTLTWHADKTFSGTFTFLGVEGTHTMAGDNFIDGTINISTGYAGYLTGEGTLYKDLDGGVLTWSGIIEKSFGNRERQYVSFWRAR